MKLKIQNRIKDLINLKITLGLNFELSKKELELAKNLAIPVQKILGFTYFDDLKIDLSLDVLIPRYETLEVLSVAKNLFANQNISILDLCCGSGILGLSLAKQFTGPVFFVDNSSSAILASVLNGKKNNLDFSRLFFIKSDLFSGLWAKKNKFDLIICNPPYLKKTKKLAKSLAGEPLNALFAPENGNYFYQKILLEAEFFLQPSGFLVFEISNLQVNFFQNLKFNFKCNLFKDINQKYRIAVCQQNKK